MSGFMERAKRPLSIRAKFVSYFEKHRVYELFHVKNPFNESKNLPRIHTRVIPLHTENDPETILQEMATELLVHQPENPKLFLKNHLDRIIRMRDLPRIILLAPPNFDRVGLAEVLCSELGIRPLMRKDLCEMCPPFDNECQCDVSERIGFSLNKVLTDRTMRDSGWILVGKKNPFTDDFGPQYNGASPFTCTDVPSTKKEAEVLQRNGILPTAVIQIIASEEPECNKNIGPVSQLLACNPMTPRSKLREYERNLQGLREAYSDFIIEIEPAFRSIEEIGKDCAKLAKTRGHCAGPSLFRIALIGSRGSGCTTVARYISERYNLVHIDFDHVAEQEGLRYSAWGRCIDQRKINIVEKRLLSYEALKRGWILTGYPKTVDDFKLLDLISTPPNRVIFMETSKDVCKERLVNRHYNVLTGSKHDLSNQTNLDCDCDMGTHPRDHERIVDRDLAEYEKNAAGMMEYAGESAVRIDGNCEKRTVQERVEACLIRPAPISQPRQPKPPIVTDLKEIEFEPDDDPNYDFADKVSGDLISNLNVT